VQSFQNECYVFCARFRKTRKSKTIGKRKLVSVKDDARRRAARDFLLGIKLDNESTTRYTPQCVAAVETEPVFTPDAATVSVEVSTPRLSRTPSWRNSKEDQPLLSRQGSLKHSLAHRDSLTNQTVLKSPFKLQTSFDQGEMIDYPLSIPVGSLEDSGKVFKSSSLHTKSEDHYNFNLLSAGQSSYTVLQGCPVAMFSVIHYKKHWDRHGRQGTRLFSLSQSFDEFDLNSDVEVSLGSLLVPVWTVLKERGEFQSRQLEAYRNDLESWMKYIHSFWKDNHNPNGVIIHYHPDHLDNEEVFYGRRARIIHHMSYMVSVIEYRKAESEKKDLNKRFRDVFPHIRVTLSKIRSIKKEMRQVSMDMQLDDGVLCYAFVYFEKMILMGKAHKSNRKFLAGASLLVAAKFLDIERSRIKSLIHEITSIMKISTKELLHSELPLLLGLQFSLFVPEHQYKRHWERLRKEEK
jgi:hypothetical protein